ncbi:MAG: protein kinase [Acidobacteria bacterium]|nr:protein kinase [Acidobacteriota bacterium]
MTPEDWQRVKSILDKAALVDAGDRDAFLRQACGEEGALRAEIESLLECEHGNLFDEAAFSIADLEIPSEYAQSFIGKEIGKYRIVSELGRGGMGLVFLAERADGEFEQKVALKLIKRGMDTDAVLRRFYNERRILATLVHPNIAHLVDGGTTDDGVPYFVMEYVDGVPLLDHARSNGLDLNARLELFQQIASAVTFAHNNLIIHRDLKPANILVTAGGVPKLLDFGIAKLLTPGNGGLITATQQFVLTPEYSSPEQVRGQQLTTATDIFSLGVILYELLTGVRPFDMKEPSFAEAIRVICETDPTLPSRVSGEPRLKGDLDNILLKALRKEPERRYSSVEQFSEDINRYLSSRPVLAADDSRSYRLQKYVKRHRFGVITGGLIFTTLLAGLGTTLYQARIAQRERERAQQRFNDVRGLANSLIFEINEKMGESPLQARELLVTRALEYLDKLTEDAAGDPGLQIELANAYEKIGELQAEIFNPGLGKVSDALNSHQKALELREKLLAASPNDVARGLDVLTSRSYVGDILTASGSIGPAREQYLNAVTLGEELLSRYPDHEGIKTRLSSTYARLGQNVLRSGSLGAALDYYQRALSHAKDVLAAKPQDVQRRRRVGIISNYIGYVKMQMLDLQDAESAFREQKQIENSILKEDPENLHNRSALSASDLWLGIALGEQGRLDNALVYLKEALDIQKRISAADPANVGEQNSLADCYVEMGKVQVWAGNTEIGLQSLREARKIYSAVSTADPNNVSAKGQIALTDRHIADSLAAKGDLAKADKVYRESIQEYEALIATDNSNLEWKDYLAVAHLHYGQSLQKQKLNADAGVQFSRAVELFTPLAQNSPDNRRLKRDLDLANGYLTSG